MTVLTLAVNNELTEDEKIRIRNKATLIAEIVCLQNTSSTQKQKYHKEYCEAIISKNETEIIRLNPYITELGGKMRAYQDCIDLITQIL